MSPTEADRKVGAILESLPNSMYRIRLEDGGQVVATPTRTAMRRWTRFIPGDRVEVALSPFDPTRARIEARLPAKAP